MLFIVAIQVIKMLFKRIHQMHALYIKTDNSMAYQHDRINLSKHVKIKSKGVPSGHKMEGRNLPESSDGIG